MTELAVNSSESHSVGARLRAAREAKELTIVQAIGDAKLNRHYIQALEDDNFSALPNATFVRGYLRRYAVLLGLSGDAIVAQYDNMHCPSPEPLNGVVTLEKVKVDPKRQMHRIMNRYVYSVRWSRVLTIASLLLIALFVLNSLFWRGEDGQAETEVVAEVPAEATPIAAEAVAIPEVTTPAPASSEPEAAAMPATEETPAPAVEPVVVPAAEPASAPAPAATDSVSETLTLSFSGKSWVSVRDGTGQELIYGLKKAGQSISVVGKPPFTINIGSVAVTQLKRNGQEIDLKPFQRGDIASFRLGR